MRKHALRYFISPLILSLAVTFSVPSALHAAETEPTEAPLDSVSESELPTPDHTNDNDDVITVQVDIPPTPVLRIVVPTELDFILDPFNLSGIGTLYSPQYSIINYSNVDIDLSINDLAYTFSNNGSFISCSEPPDQTIETEEKAVYMFLRRIVNPVLNEDSQLEEISQEQIEDSQNDDFVIMDKNEGTSFQIHLKAANYDEDGVFVSLNEDSIFLFTIMGDIRMGTSAPWNAGDLKISMVYSWAPSVPVIDLTDTKEEDADPEAPIEATPSPLAEPQPSDVPQPTATPSPTEQPGPTAEPSPSEEPQTTLDPVDSEDPIDSEDTGSTAVPTATPTL